MCSARKCAILHVLCVMLHGTAVDADGAVFTWPLTNNTHVLEVKTGMQQNTTQCLKFNQYFQQLGQLVATFGGETASNFDLNIKDRTYSEEFSFSFFLKLNDIQSSSDTFIFHYKHNGNNAQFTDAKLWHRNGYVYINTTTVNGAVVDTVSWYTEDLSNNLGWIFVLMGLNMEKGYMRFQIQNNTVDRDMPSYISDTIDISGMVRFGGLFDSDGYNSILNGSLSCLNIYEDSSVSESSALKACLDMQNWDSSATLPASANSLCEASYTLQTHTTESEETTTLQSISTTPITLSLSTPSSLDTSPSPSSTDTSSYSNETMLTNAETTLINAETTLTNDETTLTYAETTLTNAETTLTNAETTSSNAETTSPSAETTLTNAETTLTNDETTLTNAETTSYNAETTLINAETTYSNTETTSYKAETTYSNADTTYSNAETTSFNAETTSFNAETTSSNTVTTPENAETKPSNTETTSENAYTTPPSYDTTSANAETTLTDSETSLTDAETTLTDAETSLTDAETTLTDAETTTYNTDTTSANAFTTSSSAGTSSSRFNTPASVWAAYIDIVGKNRSPSELFEKPYDIVYVKTPIRCGSQCIRDLSCMSFTFSMSGACSVYKSIIENDLVVKDNVRYYKITER